MNFFAPPLLVAIEDNICQFFAMGNARYIRRYTAKLRICVEIDMAYDLPEVVFLES